MAEGLWMPALEPHLRPTPAVLRFRARHAAHGHGGPCSAVASQGGGLATTTRPRARGHARAALDGMWLPLVAAALRSQGAPAQLVAAWLVDAVGSIVSGWLSHHPIGMRGGATSLLWKLLLAGLVGDFVRRWRARGPGIDWAPGLCQVELQVWADNVFCWRALLRSCSGGSMRSRRRLPGWDLSSRTHHLSACRSSNLDADRSSGALEQHRGLRRRSGFRRWE